MSDVIDTPELIADHIVVKEGGEITLTTGDGYPDYHSYTMHHPTDELDRIHYISSYNLRYDSATNQWVKPVAGKAGFHLALESEWERTIEWNFDFTRALNNYIGRAMEVRINVDTGKSFWRWHTDETKRVQFGYVEASLARWEGESSDALMRWEVENQSPTGGAEMSVENAGGVRGAVQMSASSAGGTVFGIPYADTFIIHGGTKMIVGPSVAQPLYFMTDSTVRGSIDENGVWYQRVAGVDHAMPHDPVPWSAILPGMVSGSYYGSQFGGSRDAAVLAANTSRAAPFAVPRQTSFQSIGIEVVTPAVGSTIRLGIYEDDGTGKPGELLVDAGTVDGGFIGFNAVPVSVTLKPKLYWLVAAARDGAPVVRVMSGGGGWMIPQPVMGDSVHNGYAGTHNMNALPQTFARTGTTAFAPLVLIRTA